MKHLKKFLVGMISVIMLCITIVSVPLTVTAADPYSYSSAPSRAIYYKLPTMKGNDVKWVQAALNTYGNYGLSIDGSFGPACKAATKQFQASMGLSQDGSFGPATRAAMINWLNSRNSSTTTGTVSTAGKAFYKQSSGGCYTASAAMIMTNLGATWDGKNATYWNVYAANGNKVYLSGSTPGKFGCSQRYLNCSKSSVVDAVKKHPQGVMVAFYQPNKGWNHCMVAVGLNSSGEPLFFDPAIDNGSNGGNGLTLGDTSAGGSYGRASWNNIVQVSVISK